MASPDCPTSKATSHPEGDKPAKKLKACPIGFFHMDIAEVRTEEGKPCLLVAIDRTSKLAVPRFCDKATRQTACQFLEEVPIVVPCKLHTILTDTGIQFGPSSPATAAPSSRARAAST